MLSHNIDNYVKQCNISLALRAVRYKLYGDLQPLLVFTHYYKDLLTNIILDLPISTDWKRNSYVLILVIINQLTKIVYYKPVKITINVQSLAKIIIDVVIRYHGLLDLIVTDRGLLFTLKFWLSLCYFLSTK